MAPRHEVYAGQARRPILILKHLIKARNMLYLLCIKSKYNPNLHLQCITLCINIDVIWL